MYIFTHTHPHIGTYYILWVWGAGTVFCSWHEMQLNVSLIGDIFTHVKVFGCVAII